MRTIQKGNGGWFSSTKKNNKKNNNKKNNTNNKKKNTVENNRNLKNSIRKLREQIEAESTMSDQFDILGKLSRKLQNLVADIVKHLQFEACNSAQDLYFAIEHYQNSKNITFIG